MLSTLDHSMGLQGIEKRLERLVEGAFARAFRTELRPIELGRRVIREVDAHLTLGVKGERVAPNHIRVLLNTADYERFRPFAEALAAELADAVDEHVAEERYVMKGPSLVELIVDAKQHAGQFDVKTAVAVAPRVPGPAAWLQLADGKTVAVPEDDPVTIGRMPDCDVVINDTNVSRIHAEVRILDGRATILDLKSLNGTRLNGRGVPPDAFGLPLTDGDEVQIGNATLRFSASRRRR